jgi:hypothetical protein
MTLLLKDGDYVRNEHGGLSSLTDSGEVLQRALIKLTARRGGFPLLPELGSELYQLLRRTPAQREAQAKQSIQEALADEEDLTITGVTLTDQGDGDLHIRVDLDWQGESLTAELDVNQ